MFAAVTVGVLLIGGIIVSYPMPPLKFADFWSANFAVMAVAFIVDGFFYGDVIFGCIIAIPSAGLAVFFFFNDIPRPQWMTTK